MTISTNEMTTWQVESGAPADHDHGLELEHIEGGLRPERSKTMSENDIMTDQQIQGIEELVDMVVSGYRGPMPYPLSVARDFVICLLRAYEVPIPSDAWLDDVIRDAAKFNEVEIDEAA